MPVTDLNHKNLISYPPSTCRGGTASWRTYSTAPAQKGVQRILREFKEFYRVLKNGGRFIMDEGEPITQYIQHQLVWFFDKIFKTKLDVDSERGMEEDEQYCMPKKEIISLIKESNMELIKIEYFQWSLKKVFVAEKREKNNC